LYLSKKILSLLGGDITVQSTYGRGSTFRFTIPLGRKESSHENGAHH
ncbi:MAG: hypothetical protein JW843_12370, partial [Candidatus Aminicenantes bacterium]|nr:hypothetical protein [Candidatus Aminicenantes bacterium]